MKPPADIEKLIDELTDTFELYALCNEFGLKPFINGTRVDFNGQQLLLADVMRTLITEKSSPTINTAVNLSESQKEALKNNSSKEELDLIRAKDKITNKITSERELINSLEKFSFKTLLFTPEGKELLAKAQDVYTNLKHQPDWKTHHTREIQIPFKTPSPASPKPSQKPRQTTDQDHKAPSK